MALHPNVDVQAPGPYKEGEGFMQRGKMNEQEHEQSGNLAPSSDPVNDGAKPFKITFPKE